MKNLVLGFCLVGLAFACKSNDTATVSDSADPNLPNACETSCESSCDSAEKAECSAEKAECSSTKSECSAEKAECSSAQVCPVTGQSIE